MYDGDRRSKKESSILPKTYKFMDVEASYTGGLAEYSQIATTADFNHRGLWGLSKRDIDNPVNANIQGSIKCR